jgi:hypothetical protein
MPRHTRQRETFARSFEERTAEHLRSQDEILERVERKLDAPALNGGFETLLEKVSAIAATNEVLQKSQLIQTEKIEEIHRGIYHPEDGLYVKVKNHTTWIMHANWVIKGLIAVLGTGLVTGGAKLLYDIFQGHIHYVP